MSKRMRLPNGFGQISKLKQRLRNPYRAMVTDHWTDEGKPVRKIVGYYHTYNEAYSALMEYHVDPMALRPNITVLDLFDKWTEERNKDNGKGVGNYTGAWKYAESLYKYQVKEVRSFHIKQTIESEMPPSMHHRLHTLLNMMWDYAVEYEITDKNYSRLCNPVYDSVSKKGVKHFSFTTEEISTLWENRSKSPIVDIVLIQIYMGWRPQELVLLKCRDVDLDNWAITGGMKTENGRERTVPIHEKIKPLIEVRMSDPDEYLFGNINNYYKYSTRFKVMVAELGLNPLHAPHNPRVTFASMCKKAKVDEYARKKMMGHSIKDITDRIYTDVGIEWFRDELHKIPMETVDLV